MTIHESQTINHLSSMLPKKKRQDTWACSFFAKLIQFMLTWNRNRDLYVRVRFKLLPESSLKFKFTLGKHVLGKRDSPSLGHTSRMPQRSWPVWKLDSLEAHTATTNVSAVTWSGFGEKQIFLFCFQSKEPRQKVRRQWFTTIGLSDAYSRSACCVPTYLGEMVT